MKNEEFATALEMKSEEFLASRWWQAAEPSGYRSEECRAAFMNIREPFMHIRVASQTKKAYGVT